MCWVNASWKCLVDPIAAAIVVSAALVVVSSIAYREFARQRDIRDVQAVLQGVGAASAQAVRQARSQRVFHEKQMQRAYADGLRRQALSENQRCVGGVVVQVGGSTYAQVGTIAQPVHCTGAYADRPLR